MSKLIDADKLRAQIDRLLQNREITLRERGAYLRVLDLIDEVPDLSPTWEDIKKISELIDNVYSESHTPVSDEVFYTEVLKRFNEQR